MTTSPRLKKECWGLLPKVRYQAFWFCLLCLVALRLAPLSASELPVVVDSGSGVTPNTLGLVINANDPLSREIGRYYANVHGIPEANVFEVHLPITGNVSRELFASEYEALKARVPDTVQAFALAFWRPYKVDCMSMTSAFTFGFDPRYCANGCKTTRYSSYFNSSSRHPWSDHQLRPSMAIAARSFSHAKKLIDRGKAARAEEPQNASGFVMKTSDSARSVRGVDSSAMERWRQSDALLIEQIEGNELRGVRDLMFYFTGLSKVPSIDRNFYLPGAVADHLTSFGGKLDGTGQMSAIKWLEAGATGSYGTVVEPCNFTAKFPHPEWLINNYRRGDTLVEAYWKSVAMPGQGIFIGDPLARPWGGFKVKKSGQWLMVESPSLYSGDYEILTSDSREGPYAAIGRVSLSEDDRVIQLPHSEALAFLRINRWRRRTAIETR